MSKVHLLSQIIASLQEETTQEAKYNILSQYEKEAILKRVVSIAYNRWINLEMQNFEPKRMGKKFGMSIPKFLHIIDDMVDDKFTQKEKEFSCQMAMMHINPTEADLFVKLVRQELDLGLTDETINKVWPGLVMSYPISYPSANDYKSFNQFPAAVQPVSRGLRVNIIIHKNTVSYKDKLGQDILGWEIYDEQFINLAQGNNTVFDGHAVISKGQQIVETDNQKVLEADPKTIRFMLWDVIRFDGFTKGEDTRVGYNWRHNGIEHMQILAIDKNKQPCYDLVRADLVGSQEQLELAVSKKKSCVIKALDGTWKHGVDNTQIIID